MNTMTKRSIAPRFVHAVLGSVVVGALLATAAWATGGTRDAQGQVIDREGNPVVGATLTFTPADSANKDPVAVTTDKKGRFFANLYSDRGDNFGMTIEAAGMAPIEVYLESRTVNRVLLGDPITKRIKYGQNLPEIYIRPLGTGEVKITLVPQEELLAEAQAEAQAQAAQKATEEGTPLAPADDPWEGALLRAADGDLEDSVELFEAAIEAKPEDLERREAFAKVLYQLHRHDEAIAQAGKAVELAPRAIGPRMVIYSSHVARGDFDAAWAVLDEAHAIAPQNNQVLEQMAYVAGERGDRAAAIAAYEKIVEIDPDKADGWAQLGDMYAKNGQLEKSAAAYGKVGELDPDGAHTVYFNIGALIMNRNTRNDADTTKAVEAFRKAIELKPDYAEAHKQLAFALLGSGDRAAAKAELQAYVKYAPEAADAAQMKSLADAM